MWSVKKGDALGQQMYCFKSITVSLNASQLSLKTQGKRDDLLRSNVSLTIFKLIHSNR